MIPRRYCKIWKAKSHNFQEYACNVVSQLISCRLFQLKLFTDEFRDCKYALHVSLRFRIMPNLTTCPMILSKDWTSMRVIRELYYKAAGESRKGMRVNYPVDILVCVVGLSKTLARLTRALRTEGKVERNCTASRQPRLCLMRNGHAQIDWAWSAKSALLHSHKESTTCHVYVPEHLSAKGITKAKSQHESASRRRSFCTQ